MRAEEAKRHFEESGALLSGHFKLSSGLHSDRYLQCAKVLQWPARAEALGAALASRLASVLVSEKADVVVSPAMGGLVIGHEVGRGLRVRAIFVERVDGTFQLRRGFGLEKGERTVVIEDVVTTGKSTGEVLEVVRATGALPVACGAIVDRRGKREEGAMLAGLPFQALLVLDVASWEKSACPLCAKGVPLEAPGSRFLAAK